MPGTTVPAMAELTIRAHVAEFRRASAWLEAAGSERGVPADQRGRLDVCLNEALANVIAYGGATALAAPVQVRLEVRSDPPAGEAAVTVVDAGMAFDPLTYLPKPAPATLAEAEPGGLGVLLMRSFSDGLSYHHGDGRNRLTFRVRWTESHRSDAAK